MRLRSSGVLAAIATTLSILAGQASAQQAPRKPQIGYVYPAGARCGTTVEVVFGGQVLGGTDRVVVSGGGIKAEVIKYHRPLTIAEANRIREKLEEARKRLYPNSTGRVRFGLLNRLAEIAKEAGVTPEQLQALQEFGRRRSDPKRQPNPQIEEQVSVRLTIDPAAEPNTRELRLRTPLGLTNPVRFEVSPYNEVRETEPNDTLPDVSAGSRLPCVINGQVMPGDVDRFTFTAKKGAHIVAALRGRALVPYLADAVPGWFQAVLAVYDKSGKELAYVDDYEHRPDPILRMVIPADGQYTLVVRDAIYRGREDFVYRVYLGEIPFVSSVFPPGIRRGTSTSVRLRGWNLPAITLTLTTEKEGVRPLALPPGTLCPPDLRYQVSDMPHAAEKEPNDNASKAQKVTLPVVVNGVIERAGDLDTVQFAGRKGQRIVADLWARRLGSPLDSNIVLIDAKGERIAVSDDVEDRSAGWVTHHADSYFAVTLPHDGVYCLRVTDTQGKGGEDYVYRLRLSDPRPDFELRVTPSGIGVRAGATVPVTVHAIRRDGFDGPIDLALEDAPPGFALSGARIPAGADRVALTLTCAGRIPERELRMRLVGIAKVGGMTVRREAVPADEMMQAFAYLHLFEAREWMVDVEGEAWFVRPRVFSPDEVVRIPRNGTAQFKVPVPGRTVGPQLTVELEDPPPGVKLEKWDPATMTATLRSDATVPKPVSSGNLIFQLFVGRPNAGRNAPRRIPAGYLPAVPFVISG